MKNDYYDWYKSHHVCVSCRKETAAKGRTMCLVCLSDGAEKARAYREREPDKSREASDRAHKRLYEERKAAGLCVSCGKRPPKEGRVRCGLCLARHRRNAETVRRKRGQWSRQELTEPGVCYMCKAPSLPGKKVCAECREKNMKKLEKANAAINWDKHPWKGAET